MRCQTLSLALLTLPALPFMMGAQGDGCAAGSASPAPDGSTQALLTGAELKFTTGFTGTKP